MSTITSWPVAVWAGISAAFVRFMNGVPTILGAILILVVGWILSGIVAALIVRVCRAIRIDSLADRIGVNNFLARAKTRLTASTLLGEIIKWVIRLWFIEAAATQLGLPQLTTTIDRILGFIPNIIVALFILAIGMFLGQILAGIVRGSASEANLGSPELLAKLANGAVVAFAVIAAMNELNIAPVVVNTLYIGLVSAIALALGLAFGLGGKDVAARYAERWTRTAEEKASAVQSQLSSGPPKQVPPAQVPPPRPQL